MASLRVVLAVTGGVAAYKTVYLARRLVERGHEVQAAMSEGSLAFLGPQSLAAVTQRPVHVRLLGGDTPSPHTEMARWADVIVVAPATASLLGRLAAGISDDLITATLMAARSPVVLAPAMHTEMWEHPATRRNVATLREHGYRIVGPASGALAGGDEGPGRMVEPDILVLEAEAAEKGYDLTGRQVLVTAGGTREPIDPVRYVGNRSSGKMGTAIAEAAAARGAQVQLVTTAYRSEHPAVETVCVGTAEEMAGATWERAGGVDVAVFAAAVADFRPSQASATKLRRADGPPQLRLEPTPDILAGVADMTEPPMIVGFAAETGGIETAKEKATRKNLDLLVANDVSDRDSGFGTDTNRVALIEPDGTLEHWPLMTKWEVAMRLWDVVAARLPEVEGR